MGTERKAIGNMPEWMRDQERKSSQQARRRQVTQASDILGPGFGPTSTVTDDWSSDIASFTGFFYSVNSQVVNSPDDTLDWIGSVIALPGNVGGIQEIWSVAVGDPPQRYARRWFSASDVRNYTTWQVM